METYRTCKLDNVRIPRQGQLPVKDLVNKSDEVSQLDCDCLDLGSITVIAEIGTGFVPPSVLSYISTRKMNGYVDLSAEARALRMYFDFLAAYQLRWDVGAREAFRRPINQFSRFLESEYASGNIAGTTATNYFNVICRFYKHHLQLKYPFKGGVPVEFRETTFKKHDGDLMSHITGREITLEVATCRPNIPAKDKATELLPFSPSEKELFFGKVASFASPEFPLICLFSLMSGLRADEIGDLRLDMITRYSGSGVYNLQLGPKVGHKTKLKSDMPVKVSGELITRVLQYTKSSHYLKRLAKYKGDRPNLFLTQFGTPYTQHTISTMFNQFLHAVIYEIAPNFEHKFHDLRVTFGADTMGTALDNGLTNAQALAWTNEQMRHKNIKDTQDYLEYFSKAVAYEEQANVNEELLGRVLDMVERVVK